MAEPERGIDLYVTRHNADPMPFIWIARASDIPATFTRAKAGHATAFRSACRDRGFAAAGVAGERRHVSRVTGLRADGDGFEAARVRFAFAGLYRLTPCRDGSSFPTRLLNSAR